jgi:molybdate transport system regulatory protein
MARLTIRVDLGKEAAFGPGKARLLEEISDKGSIRAAAVAMKMSYRRAWLLVQDIETIMGAPVVAAETGGVHGGGAKLTALGNDVVKRYRAIETRASRAVAAELHAMERIAKGTAAPVQPIVKRKRRASR